MSKKIGYVGLTHLGLIYSLASAKKGFEVFAFDYNQKLISEINMNKINIQEPKLNFMIKKYKKNIKFTDNFNDLNKCSIVFFSYDTPTNKNLESDFHFIRNKLNKTISKLSHNISLVILSQVIPGFTEKIKFPKNKLFYQVETLVFGSAFERALKPERVIIGSQNKKIPKNINEFYKYFTKNIIVTNYNTAELSKIAINLYLSSSISTTNTINEFAYKINSDWSDLKYILQLDKRIGRYAYLNPGLGISGGNLERDNSNFIKLSKRTKTNSTLIKVFLNNSKYQKTKFLKDIKSKVINLKGILIYGLTYKENTHSIKNSISIDLIEILKNKLKIFYYDKNIDDYHISKNYINFFDLNLSFPKEIECIIIFHKPLINHLKNLLEYNSKNDFLIFDPYGFLKNKISSNFTSSNKYFSLSK